MARPQKSVLAVTLEKRGNAWRLKWGRAGTMVRATLGVIPDALAGKRRDEIQGALLNGHWPEWCKRIPQIRAFASGAKEEAHARIGGDIYADFAEHLENEVHPRWRSCCLLYLRELKAWAHLYESGHRSPSSTEVRGLMKTPVEHMPEYESITPAIAQA